MAFLERLKLRRSASAEAGAPAPFAPPIAPKLKARITELGQLFFPGRGARRLFPSAKLEAAPPDPAKILFSDNGTGDGSGRAGQYREIADGLIRDARDLDTVEARNADIVGRALANTLIDRSAHSAVGGMIFLLQVALGLTLVGALIGLGYRAVNEQPFGAFGYGALYLFLGFVAAMFMSFLMDSAVGGALRRFRRAENNLVALVRETTSDFHERLVRLRAAMEANAASDFPKAIAAASEARLITVSALRFFEQAPVVGADAGEKSEPLIGALRERAGAGLKTLLAMIAAILAAGAAFAAGAAALYFNAAEPPQIGAPLEMLRGLLALETAEPGRVILPGAIAVALAAPIFLAPVLVLLSANANTRAFLGAEPTRSLVNSLHAKALAAAAERKGELIERYADAQLSLEKRAQGWASRGASFSEDDTPAWRKAPEAPRFVETGFQAAPKSFLVDPAAASTRRRGRPPGKKN